MKKECTLLIGLVVLSLAAAGCGKDKKADAAPTPAPVTVAPVEEENTSSELVNMEVVPEEEDENVMGTKTDTAAKVTITNQTGSEIGEFYIRVYDEDNDDDEWGDELIKGAFTLENGEKAVYYYEKGSAALYDLRIAYTEEGRNECFFRRLPLPTITELSLCMDGTGEEAIPYARYFTGTGSNERSTLDEVKARLGLLDDDDDSDYDDGNDSSDYDDAADSGTSGGGSDDGSSGDDGSGGAEEPSDPGNEEPDYEQPDQMTAAEGYIGQDIGSLQGELGAPVGEDYWDEPETGRTGYYYYETDEGTFTVSTSIDENGNEVVTGVW